MQDDQTPAVGEDADAITTDPETDTTPPDAAPDAPSPQAVAAAPLADPQAAARAERARARAITETAMLAGLPNLAADLIAQDITADQARQQLLAIRQETDMTTGQNRPAPGARVTRDERETRRIGMTAALVAQITRRAPQAGEAEPFMQYSIAEMAAICAGIDGRLRTPGDRDNALRMAAGHTSGDFPLILENALNRVMLERYEAAPVTYRAIARERSFNDFRPHNMLRAGDFPTLERIDPASGEIKFGTLGEARETVTLKSYAKGIRITRQMLINDDMGLIDDIVGDIGNMVADFEEVTFYDYFETATLSDTVSVWHASRGNLGTAGAIGVTTIGEGRALMRKQTAVDGSRKINLSPTILLVSPDEETAAQQLTSAIQPQEAGKVNPFSGTLQVVTSAQLAAGAWYLMADPGRPGGACFVYGYLNGAAAPRIRMDEPFGQQGIAYTVEHDFGVGAIDYRGTVKNTGPAE